jgi:ankyrin repeat protein
MDPEEEKKKDPGDDLLGDSDEEDEENQMTPEELSMKLMEACKENLLDDVEYWLENKASPIFKSDGWSPILWAACNGNEAIVRALLKHKAHAEYIDDPDDDD